MLSFWSVLCSGIMKGDFFGWDGLAGRQGCKRYSWLAGRVEGGESGEGLLFDVSSIIRATLPGLCAD